MSKSADIQLVVATSLWIEKNVSLLNNFKEKVFVTERRDLTEVSQLSTPSPVLVVASKKEQPLLDFDNLPFSIYLDGIQNPGNLGAILRIADWYGIQSIFLSEDCVDVYNAKAIQASMGSFLRVNAYSIDLELLKKENYSLLGATLNGNGVWEKRERSILIIGNEGKGIRPNNRKILDEEIALSRNKSLGAESLNAVVATGILCEKMLS